MPWPVPQCSMAFIRVHFFVLLSISAAFHFVVAVPEGVKRLCAKESFLIEHAPGHAHPLSPESMQQIHRLSLLRLGEDHLQGRHTMVATDNLSSILPTLLNLAHTMSSSTVVFDHLARVQALLKQHRRVRAMMPSLISSCVPTAYCVCDPRRYIALDQRGMARMAMRGIRAIPRSSQNYDKLLHLAFPYNDVVTMPSVSKR